MSDEQRHDLDQVQGSIWFALDPDWGYVRLRRADPRDPEEGAQGPYRLTFLDWDGLPVCEYPLGLKDLRSLHRQLTEELAIVATQGRWPGRGGSRQ